MTDETGTTSEVARVLELHHHKGTEGQRHVCGCGFYSSVTNGGHQFAMHQAGKLAEAGLLRDDRRLLPDLKHERE